MINAYESPVVPGRAYPLTAEKTTHFGKVPDIAALRQLEKIYGPLELFNSLKTELETSLHLWRQQSLSEPLFENNVWKRDEDGLFVILPVLHKTRAGQIIIDSPVNLSALLQCKDIRLPILRPLNRD